VAYLRVEVENNIYKDFDLEQGRTSIGRNTKNGIVIDSPSVSNNHAHLNFEQGFFLTDLRSSNGTFINGKKILHTKLKDKDIINFADIPATFYE